MDICVRVSVCVRGWVAKKKGSYLRHLRPASECLPGLSLSILAWRSHKELRPRKPERQEEKDEGRNQSEMRLRNRVRNSSPRRGAGQSAPGRESRAIGGQYGVKNEDIETVKTMTKGFCIFVGCIGFSLSYRDNDTYTKNLKTCQLHLLSFCSS